MHDGHFWSGMSVYRLAQHLGLARARRIVLWGTDIPLAEATDMGLVDQVGDDLVEGVHTAAVSRGRLSDLETRIRRLLLQEAAYAEYDDALGAHLAACDRELRRLRTPGGTGRTEITLIHLASRGAYGVRRVHAELRRLVRDVNRKGAERRPGTRLSHVQRPRKSGGRYRHAARCR
ncbi:hypothetical protein [Streptomyces rapamycinicus]|uniref:Enoyl-CoA hydratase/carnithine racemase n=1 Tax=Streptomyces rapamycinicus TaxID=1226757 RepID=A0ABR6L9T2_9ACTN|nr:hypothetical protein [Streptomyces rapamycinicus]AGP51685.1 hypothetical protein M271_00230 [Streptomyces rapamycinicus NRRL 5491]MBB4779093.1 enoyl-CoA hydratase/carnithine racemase [Streptomyces rapamycinicus]UTP27920.1 hypothetical protein LIV37_00045 [Streptomyces rapamycinicus NRRL 5491]